MIAWTEAPPLPVAVGGGCAAAIGSAIVYAGGTAWKRGTRRWWLDAVYVADGAGNWGAGPRLPASSAYGACALFDAGLEIYGGAGEGGAHYACWRLQPGESRWRAIGLLPSPAVLARAEAVGGEL